MVEAKLEALRQRGVISERQEAELRAQLSQGGTFPALGERVRLVESAEEALLLAKGGRYALLEIARDPKEPERVLFVLKLQGAELASGQRLGRPRTWLLFGVALGALLSALVQLSWPRPTPEPTRQPVFLQPSSPPPPSSRP